MNGNGVERDAILRQLERVLASTPFRQADRSAGLLRYLVERSLNGSGERVKEYTVGVEYLGRGTEFDPRTDPIVRAEASRLRGRLEKYYAGEGRADDVIIELPKGSYAPRFGIRPPPAPVETIVEAPPLERARLQPAILWGVIGVLTLFGAFAAGLWSARASVGGELPVRAEILLQSDELIGSDVGTDVAISPDGTRAAYTSIDSLGRSHLRLRTFDGTPPVDLPGTIGGRGAFWSPDGRWIGFWAARELRKIAVEGGSPVTLCEAEDLLGASWADDGTVIATLSAKKQLWRVDGTSGGTPVSVLDLTARNAYARWPQVLPGGKYVLYTSYSAIGADQGTIEVASLTGGEPRVLVTGATFGRFIAPDYLTFVNQGTLYAIRFDPKRLEVSGAKVPILSDVSYSGPFGFAQISFANSGAAIYRRASSNEGRIVARIDSTGRQTKLLDAGQWTWPALSADGQRLAITAVDGGATRLSVFTELGAHPRLAGSSVGLEHPTWTRDGRFIVGRGDSGIVSLSAAGMAPRVLIRSADILVPWSFGPGDRSLAYTAFVAGTAADLWTAPVENTGNSLNVGSATPLVQTASFEAYPAISPDGRWLAYVSSEAGAPRIVVRSFADSSAKVVIGPGPGGVPRWSRSAQRLFFMHADGRIMVVSYSIVAGKFVPSTPRPWSPLRIAKTNVLSAYDVGTDDSYVIALLPAPSRTAQAENHVTLIHGLSEELKRKVP